MIDAPPGDALIVIGARVEEAALPGLALRREVVLYITWELAGEFEPRFDPRNIEPRLIPVANVHGVGDTGIHIGKDDDRRAVASAS